MAVTFCDLCGAETELSEMIELEGRKVCVSCKPNVVQRLREGLDITTPAPVAELKLASRWKRLGAAILDALFASVINIPIALMLGVVSFSNPALNNQIGNRIIGTLIGFGVYFLLNGYLLATRSQTIGKAICQMKIVRTNGDRIGFGRIVGLRLLPLWIVAQVPVVGAILGLADSLMIFRGEKNCLHDDIADTRVIDID